MGDRLNTSSGNEAAVTARTRIEWITFRECGELLYGRKFLLKMKGRVYQSSVRSAMLDAPWLLLLVIFFVYY